MLPAILFGVEIWGVRELQSIARGKKSPYTSGAMTQLVNIVKSTLGLHRLTFKAPLYKILNLPTLFSVGFP